MTTSLRTSHSTAARGKGARLSCPSIKDLSLNPTQERPSRPSRPLSERVSNSLRVLVEPGRLSPRARKQSLQDFPDSYSCPRDQSPEARYSTSCVPAPLDYEQELSQIDSAGSLFLAKTLPDLPPSSIIWDSPGWGDWAPHDFTHCIYIVTEEEAIRQYEFKGTLPPVYETKLEGVLHMWLIVPAESEGLSMQLTDHQLAHASEFWMRTVTRLVVVDGPSCPPDAMSDIGDVTYEEVRVEVPPKMLLSCGEGHEANVAGVTVALLTSLGGTSAYSASETFDGADCVCASWKGLLSWEDVERIETLIYG